MSVTTEIIKLLLMYPEGLTSRQIDDALISNGLIESSRETVASTICRLKKNEIIEQYNVLYRMKKFEEHEKIPVNNKIKTDGYLTNLFIHEHFKPGEIIDSRILRQKYFSKFKQRWSKQAACVFMKIYVLNGLLECVKEYNAEYRIISLHPPQSKHADILFWKKFIQNFKEGDVFSTKSLSEKLNITKEKAITAITHLKLRGVISVYKPHGKRYRVLEAA